MTLVSDLEAEEQFVEQRFEFLDKARELYPKAPTSLDELMARAPQPLEPVVVEDLAALTTEEVDEIAATFEGGYGVVSVVPISFQPRTHGGRHSLLAFTERLSERVPIGVPVDHPMESHPEAVKRFGAPDGTLKIYNLPMERGGPRYREQAETNEMFHAHNDGLGYAGLIRTAVLILDRPPLSGGYTFFQNIVRAAPAIAASDPEAFRALFLPDTIRALRPRGKGAIKVESPVLFLGRDGRPQAFFRVSTGEYEISWRNDPAVGRARAILDRLCAPLGPDSRFVHLMRLGDTVIIVNQLVAHGRTPFIDPPDGSGRVLARKWFVPTEDDAVYRHVPGMVVDERWAALFPTRFTGDAIEGEWHFDGSRGENVRIG
jgi:hypothetical protein